MWNLFRRVVGLESHEMAELRVDANAGDADAQVHLGIAYALGQGVPQDYVEAVSWYRKAADQGNVIGLAQPWGFVFQRGGCPGGLRGSA
jgi:TPR repeat protein